MSKGGGLMGSQKSKGEIPRWAENFAKDNLNKANAAASIGYLPWTGPDVAALNGMQKDAIRGSQKAGAAFGLSSGGDPFAGMPEEQTFAGGVKGYSSFPMFDQAVQELYQRAPGSMEAYDSLYAQNLPPGMEGQGRYFDPNNPEHVAGAQAYAAQPGSQVDQGPPAFTHKDPRFVTDRTNYDPKYWEAGGRGASIWSAF